MRKKIAFYVIGKSIVWLVGFTLAIAGVFACIWFWSKAIEIGGLIKTMADLIFGCLFVALILVPVVDTIRGWAAEARERMEGEQ